MWTCLNRFVDNRDGRVNSEGTPLWQAVWTRLLTEVVFDFDCWRASPIQIHNNASSFWRNYGLRVFAKSFITYLPYMHFSYVYIYPVAKRSENLAKIPPKSCIYQNCRFARWLLKCPIPVLWTPNLIFIRTLTCIWNKGSPLLRFEYLPKNLPIVKHPRAYY